MRKLILTIACLLVPVSVMMLDAFGQDADKPAEAGKTENCARIETDAKTGIWRVWIALDKDHATVAKFKTAPTETDIRAVREKVLAQEAEALAQAAELKLAEAKKEQLKAEGKCEYCGQPLPLKEGEE